jgi:hypothetical protein
VWGVHIHFPELKLSIWLYNNNNNNNNNSNNDDDGFLKNKKHGVME